MRATLIVFLLGKLDNIQTAILNDDDLFIDPVHARLHVWCTVALGLLRGDSAAEAAFVHVRDIIYGPARRNSGENCGEVGNEKYGKA
jgi:hypothetical protein